MPVSSLPPTPNGDSDTAPNNKATAAAPEAAENATEPRGFLGLSTTALAFVSLLIVIAGLIGYVIGDKTAQRDMPAASTGASASTAAMDSAPGVPSYDDVIAAVTAGGNGGRGDGPKPVKDGLYDAQFWGPRGPLRTQEDTVNLHRRNENDPFAFGAIDAPVVISEFSDLECPFCSQFANTTEPELVQDYVDKGLVRFEWNDLPINGPHAEAAARAGRAAAEQGKFFEFKKALYAASANIPGHPDNDIDNFVSFAEEAGVPDLDKFRADATSDKYDDAINRARAYASSIGVQGTPGFVIGMTFVGGAQPTEIFRDTINQELQRVADGEVGVPEADARSSAELAAAQP